MPFQVPPTLPDYKKLTFMLNSSGVQKWNPAMYDILNKLIEAVSQSQDVVVNSIIPTSSVPFGGVVVDPAGALSGDGTIPSPLAVKVDGTSVIINGSNQLQASTGGIFFNTGTFGQIALGSTTQIVVEKLNTNPLLVIPGTVGKITVPIYMSTHYISSGSGGFTATISPTLVYASIPTIPILQVGQLATNTVPKDITNMAWAGSGGTITPASGATVVGENIFVSSAVNCFHGNDVIYDSFYIIAYQLMNAP